MNPRYDVVLFGATGFTGRLTAGYLAGHAPDRLRWALAGRNPDRLAAVRDTLGPAHAGLPLLTADVEDPESLAEVAASARVVATTVGPYLRHGEPLVAACAEAGTDYVDLTGESEFVDTMYLRYHARAQQTGARIVHACGFDSVPYDLGVLFTVRLLPEAVPIRVTGLVRAGGTPSGGTVRSALTAMSRAPQMRRAARDRHRAEPRPDGRSARAVGGRLHREQGFWAVPLPTIDPQIVARSAAALPAYGPDFGYRHYAAVRRLPVALGGMAGAAGLMAAAQVPPVRRLLENRITPGSGPDPARRAKSWFRVRFVGEGGGRRVITEVAGGDPGYGETAKMLAESALCLALDELPAASGQLTTAVAMGDPLTRRLVEAGISFRVLATEEY